MFGPSRPSWATPGVAAALTAGLLAGISPLLHGMYDRTAWGLLGVGAFASAMTALVAARRLPPRAALVPPVALAALAGWQLLSRTWAESGEQAVLSAQRTAVLAGCLFVLVMALRGRRAQATFFVALAAGAVAAALVEYVRLLASPVPDDFVTGRLNDPLGYTNGQAAAMLAGFWPCIALVERARRPLGAVLPMAAGSFLLSMALMTQSRAALGALAVSMVLLVLALPGRGRRLTALAVACASVAVSAGKLGDVYASGPVPDTGLVHDALGLIAIGAALAALAWLAVELLGRAVAGAVDLARLRRPALVAGGAVLLVAVAVAAAPAARGVERGWDQFRSLDAVSTDSRLTSAGGNRYDYWRVAVRQFRSAPVKGIGAGNYDTTYFRERRTREDIRQPHSVFLQALAETGVVGLALLLLFVSGLLVAGVRARAATRGSHEGQALLVAGAGTLALWLVHTSVDWMHLLPAVSLAALGSAAVVLRLGFAERTGPEPRHGAFRAISFAVALVAVGSLVASVLADRGQRDAERLVATDPRAAIERASASLRLDGESMRTHYVLAAAYARLGRYEDAVATLRRAEALEPSDFVPPTLIGDLAVRRGDLALARRQYRRAIALNPLADGPRAALAQASTQAP